MTKDDPLDVLIHGWFEGRLAPDEERQLWEAVRSDPKAADRFVERAELESGLVETMKAAAELPAGVRLPGRTSRRPRRPQPARRTPPWIPALAAAGLFAAALLLAIARASRPEPAPAVAQQPPAPAPEQLPSAPPPEPSRPEPPRREAPPEPAPPPPETAPPPAPPPPPSPAPRTPEAPRPEPARQERPEPPPARPAPAPESRVAAATLERGILKAGSRNIRAGEPVFAGEPLHAASAGAALRMEDGTLLEPGPDAVVREIRSRTVALAAGSLRASVARAAGVPFLLSTPHAEVRVLGTKLFVSVGTDSTRVEVEEGRVRVRRLPDGPAADVAAGQFAVAGPGAAPTARPLILTRSFQDGAAPTPDYAGTRDTTLSSREPTVNLGTREMLGLYQAADHQLVTLLKWDISSIPPGSRVLAAEIAVWVTGTVEAAGYRVYEARRPWEEREATWRLASAGQPWQTPGAQADLDRGTRPLATLAPATPGLYTFALNEAGVALVQAWVRAPAVNRGLVVSGTGPAPGWEFNARESAPIERRPRLTVTYHPPVGR